ncbi:Uncharacterised protein [Mycobacteroides abscessus]|nr:Uncharacterised protein [Mycobacteroides abscessus]
MIAARAAIGSSPVNHDDTRGTTYPDRNTRAPPPASSVKPRPGWLAHHCRQRWPPSWLGESCWRVPELAKMSLPKTLAPPNSSAPATTIIPTCTSCEGSDHPSPLPESPPVICAHHPLACPRITHQIPAAPTMIPAAARSSGGTPATEADNTAETGARARRHKAMPLPRAVNAKHSRITQPRAPAAPSPRVSTCKPHTPATNNAAPTIPAAKPVNWAPGDRPAFMAGRVCVGASSPSGRSVSVMG